MDIKTFVKIVCAATVLTVAGLAYGDNINVTQGSGTVMATDVVGGANYQRVKISLGADGSATDLGLGQAAMAASMPVVLASDQASIPVTVSGVATAANQTTIIGHVDGVEGLLGTIDADTGGILTSVQLLDNAISGSEMQVDVVAALPAGNNNIGDVDVATIAAGDNNIGNVDVVTLPALAAGNNNIGDVDVASIAAGNNNIGDVDVASLPALPAGSNIIGSIIPVPGTSGGNSIYRNLDLDETGVSIKGSAGQLYGYYVCNRATAERFLKLYNKATAATVGTDTPVITIPLAAGSADKPTCANVGWDTGVAFGTGLAAGATTGIADNNTGAPAANDVVVNIFYK